MALSVISITPQHQSINNTVDPNIVLTFSSNVDPFTIASGISLYTLGSGLWTGPDLAKLDTIYRNTSDSIQEYISIPITYTVNNNIVTIHPQEKLLPNKEYYISIFSGTDITKFVSTLTTTAPIYERISNSAGIVNILSAYTGSTNGQYQLIFSGSNTFSLTFNSTILGDYTLPEEDNTELSIGDLSLSFTGTFDSGDTVSIDVIKGVCLDSIFKSKFTTGIYEYEEPSSETIEETGLPKEVLYITQTIPENLSINNHRCNPVTIRFNKTLDNTQNLINKIKIIKETNDLRPKKNVNFYYKIIGDTLKIYLLNVIQ
jgi:hypothetical protein